MRIVSARSGRLVWLVIRTRRADVWEGAPTGRSTGCGTPPEAGRAAFSQHVHSGWRKRRRLPSVPAVGPMKAMPFSSHVAANSVFSERKP